MKSRSLAGIFLLLASVVIAATPPDSFVLIKAGTLRAGIHLDEFEMAAHPVTNAEYKAFIDATRHPAPPYWVNGRIPAGMENHPVIFVSRYNDVRAYTNWRSAKEGRVYRLPTSSEFEYAARAGRNDIKFPWGNEGPAGKANFSTAGGERDISIWRERLQPVRRFAANPWGLYDMAGNIFQMVEEYPDYTLGGYIFRITSPDDREGWAMGGSWARAEYYLQLGTAAYQLEGIRKPDLGFRLVREPAGSTHFRRQPRRIVAASAGERKVFLSWQLQAEDPENVGFHVYRTQYRHAAGERLTAQPVRESTTFIDPKPPGAKPVPQRGGPNQPAGELRSYYRVRAVGPDGKEGPPSEWVGIEPTEAKSGLLAEFRPNLRQGGFTPMFGDVDGDSVVDVVFRLENGITERSADPGIPVELEAFTSYGRSIWRRPLVWHSHAFGNGHNSPVLLYDLDDDGKSEVVCRLQEGNETFLAVLNGMTGDVLRKTPWTPLVSDLSRSSTRIVLGVAYLDGKTPAIITQSGLYENEIFTAYEGTTLKQLWQFKSFAETNGSGAHYIEVADVDGDGRDEVFDGSTVLNHDGTLRWSIYAGHPDVVAIKHIIPGLPGRQVFFAIEDNTNAGAYVVNASDGKVIWKQNREEDVRWTHAHTGWAADISEAHPGLEMMTNRDGHLVLDTVLLAADGTVLVSPFPRGYRPINWLGNKTREIMTDGGRGLMRFDGKEFKPIEGVAPPIEGNGRVLVSADLSGDFRDEVVTREVVDERPVVRIYTNATPISRREVTRLADREYRMWLARNLGAGYGQYFEWQAKQK